MSRNSIPNRPALLRQLLLACTLLICSLAASALETITKLVPIEGPWVSPDMPNTAWFLEVDEQDFGFVAWYTYDAEGRATFLTMQGQLTYRTEQQRRESGVIASMQSTIFEADNGGCPTCPPRPANIRPSALGDAEFVWSASRRGTIRYAGRTIGLQALDLTWPEERSIEGTWRLDSRDIDLTSSNPHFRARYGSAVVRIFRNAGPILLNSHPAEDASLPAGDRANYNFGVLPSPLAAYYTVECVTGCSGGDLYGTNAPESTATKPGRWVMWFEGGIWRMSNVFSVNLGQFPTATQINGGSLVGDMFVTQNQITIRRRAPKLDALQLHSADVVLSRLPANWARP